MKDIAKRLNEINESLKQIAYSEAKCDNYDIARMLLLLSEKIDILSMPKNET